MYKHCGNFVRTSFTSLDQEIEMKNNQVIERTEFGALPLINKHKN